MLLLTLLLSVVPRYLSGGTASGLKHVTNEHEPAMYHVKGKRQVRVHQLPKVNFISYDISISTNIIYQFIIISSYTEYHIV